MSGQDVRISPIETACGLRGLSSEAGCLPRQRRLTQIPAARDSAALPGDRRAVRAKHYGRKRFIGPFFGRGECAEVNRNPQRTGRGRKGQPAGSDTEMRATILVCGFHSLNLMVSMDASILGGKGGKKHPPLGVLCAILQSASRPFLLAGEE